MPTAQYTRPLHPDPMRLPLQWPFLRKDHHPQPGPILGVAALATGLSNAAGMPLTPEAVAHAVTEFRTKQMRRPISPVPCHINVLLAAVPAGCPHSDKTPLGLCGTEITDSLAENLTYLSNAVQRSGVLHFAASFRGSGNWTWDNFLQTWRDCVGHNFPVRFDEKVISTSDPCVRRTLIIVALLFKPPRLAALHPAASTDPPHPPAPGSDPPPASGPAAPKALLQGVLLASSLGSANASFLPNPDGDYADTAYLLLMGFGCALLIRHSMLQSGARWLLGALTCLLSMLVMPRWPMTDPVPVINVGPTHTLASMGMMRSLLSRLLRQITVCGVLLRCLTPWLQQHGPASSVRILHLLSPTITKYNRVTTFLFWFLLIAGIGWTFCGSEKTKSVLYGRLMVIFTYGLSLLNGKPTEGFWGAIKDAVHLGLPWATATGAYYTARATGIRQHHSWHDALGKGLFVTICAGLYHITTTDPSPHQGVKALSGVLLAYIPPYFGPMLPEQVVIHTIRMSAKLSFAAVPASFAFLTYWHPGHAFLSMAIALSALIALRDIKGMASCWKSEWRYIRGSRKQVVALLLLRMPHWATPTLIALLTLHIARCGPTVGPYMARVVEAPIGIGTTHLLTVTASLYISGRYMIRPDMVPHLNFFTARRRGLLSRYTHFLYVAAFGAPHRLMRLSPEAPQGVRAPFWSRMSLRFLAILSSVASHHASNWRDAGCWHLLFLGVSSIDALAHHQRAIAHLASAPGPTYPRLRWITCAVTPWSLVARGTQALFMISIPPWHLAVFLFGVGGSAYLASLVSQHSVAAQMWPSILSVYRRPLARARP